MTKGDVAGSDIITDFVVLILYSTLLLSISLLYTCLNSTGTSKARNEKGNNEGKTDEITFNGVIGPWIFLIGVDFLFLSYSCV